VTGAPKISTMSLIARLEASPRQVYCGAVGLVTPESATFSVAIRTALIDSQTGQAEYGVGGGITWDSEPGDEYEEALVKARVLVRRRPDFDLLETLRLEDGQFCLTDRHLDRLERSAGYFDIPFSTSTARNALVRLSDQYPVGLHRARLLLNQAGVARVECFPFAPASGLQQAAIARSGVDSADPFLFHKTTHRDVYERHRSEMGSRFDVLLWNEREEATEFATGNLVVEVAGQRYTPPVECGLLPGVFREELLATGAVQERAVKLADVRAAERVWHINSLRGWTKIRLEE
jgi:para-aminobenzoate synthetase/4-amino-4-deoxychorismate lyase